MTGPGARSVTWFTVIAVAVVLALSVMALMPGSEGRAAPLWLVGAIGAGAWIGLILFHEAARRHFDSLRLLQSGLEAMAAGQMPPGQLSTRFAGRGGTPVGRLAALILDVATRRALEGGKPDQRLASVIAALKDGVVVVTESGLVSLINAGGKSLLGSERACVGTSVYAALDRDSLLAAMALARSAGRKAVDVVLATVEGVELEARIVDFGEHRGAVLTFPAAEVELGPSVEVALDLHDRPPEAPPPVPATRLDALPVTVFDTETTGLDVTRDRIVSVGGVRLHGGRVFRSTVLDRLVNPGKRIPQRSTAVHGITDAMVLDAPSFAEILPEVRALTRDTVVVGHNIGFDLAMLRRSAAEAGLAWTDPPWLDTLLLAGALDPEETDLNLDAMAERLGVNVSGRHTALGDSLVTAEIYVRLLPQLERRGVRTLGEAEAFQRQARAILAQQRAAGW